MGCCYSWCVPLVLGFGCFQFLVLVIRSCLIFSTLRSALSCFSCQTIVIVSSVNLFSFRGLSRECGSHLFFIFLFILIFWGVSGGGGDCTSSLVCGGCLLGLYFIRLVQCGGLFLFFLFYFMYTYFACLFSVCLCRCLFRRVEQYLSFLFARLLYGWSRLGIF